MGLSEINYYRLFQWSCHSSWTSDRFPGCNWARLRTALVHLWPDLWSNWEIPAQCKKKTPLISVPQSSPFIGQTQYLLENLWVSIIRAKYRAAEFHLLHSVDIRKLQEDMPLPWDSERLGKGQRRGRAGEVQGWVVVIRQGCLGVIFLLIFLF